jgi:hypothetical protein
VTLPAGKATRPLPLVIVMVDVGRQQPLPACWNDAQSCASLSGRLGAAGCADAIVEIIVTAAASKIVFTIIASGPLSMSAAMRPDIISLKRCRRSADAFSTCKTVSRGALLKHQRRMSRKKFRADVERGFSNEKSNA